MDRDCKAYEKPLADVPLRFTNELHDTIDTVKCSDLSTKEFYEKYIRLKIPVKIKDCKHSQIDSMDGFMWQGLVKNKNDGNSLNVKDVPESTRKQLLRDNFLLNFNNNDGDGIMRKSLIEEMALGSCK